MTFHFYLCHILFTVLSNILFIDGFKGVNFGEHDADRPLLDRAKLLECIWECEAVPSLTRQHQRRQCQRHELMFAVPPRWYLGILISADLTWMMC